MDALLSVVLSIPDMFMLALIVASIVLSLIGIRTRKYGRVSRAFFNIDPQLYRFRSPVPGPREAMENLEREIKESRRRAYHPSHYTRSR